jgi:hypothetical protein
MSASSATFRSWTVTDRREQLNRHTSKIASTTSSIPSARRVRLLIVTGGILTLAALTGCTDLTFSPPTYPICPPSCHAGKGKPA